MSEPKYHWNDGKKSPVRICFTSSPAPLRPHVQEELELMYFFETVGCRYKCNGREICFSGGELAIVNPGELHSCNEWGRGCRAVCIMISANRMTYPTFLGIHFKNRAVLSEIGTIFKRLEAILREEKNAAVQDCAVLGCIYELLALLVKHFACNENHLCNSRRSEFCSVMEYIAGNLSKSIRICDLSTQMNLSEDRFYHAFKEFLGVSPTEYILGERIAKACELLADTASQITYVAQECGFCTASYFSKKFREYMNISPSNYRRALINRTWQMLE